MNSGTKITNNNIYKGRYSAFTVNSCSKLVIKVLVKKYNICSKSTLMTPKRYISYEENYLQCYFIVNYSYVILAFLMVILVLWSFEWGKKFKGIAIDDQMTTWIYYYVLDTFKCISPLELHLNSWKGTKCSFSFLAFPNILASENQFFIDGFKNMVPSKFLPAPSIYARPPTL